MLPEQVQSPHRQHGEIVPKGSIPTLRQDGATRMPQGGLWERERKRMLRCNSADRGCVACSGQHHVAGNGADFSPVLALETVYGTDAGSKANDDGASRWCGFPHAW